MQRRTTSHDVARMAGVSQSAVSLVLNGRTDTRIPEPTRQRILDAARALNYTRNAAAHALLTGRSHRIGIVPIHPHAFTDQGSYYGTLMTNFIKGSMRHGYNLLLHTTHHEQWEEIYRDILGHSADGVILIGRPSRDPLTLALLQARFPTVTVSYQPDADCYHSVDCDNHAGGYMAAQHLLNLGHRRLGIIAPHPEYSWEAQRCAGARQAVADAGLPPECLRSFVCEERSGQVEDLARNLCAQPAATRITALLSRDEYLAGELIPRLETGGLRIPRDLAILCFNSTEACEHTRPALTAVGQSLEAVGTAAIDMLVDILHGKEVIHGTRRVPMRLDVRESCGARRAERN